MVETSYQHQAVLLAEVIENMAIKPDGFYVDATFGRGGHSKALLERLGLEGHLLAIDKDPEAIAYAKHLFANDTRFSIYHGTFADLSHFIHCKNENQKIDGILFDLGVSSPQLDNPHRGFSFQHSGQLDMRMDNSSGQAAADWLASVDEKTLTTVLKEYGEERFSRRIARAIIKARSENTIEMTQQLANIISAAHPAWEKGKNPATRSFQAIRIAINNELDDLKKGLIQALECLKIGGRLLVISFHSLEDRIVKQFIQHHERLDHLPSKLPVKHVNVKPKLKRLGGVIRASEKEVSMNPRARSAVLRIAEKQS